MRMTPAEFLLSVHLTQGNIDFTQEFHPCPERGWRCDFVIKSAGLIIEVEGGVYADGRHTRGSGFEADCEKYNWCVEHGWRVLRYTTAMVESNAAFEQIRRIVEASHAHL